MSLIQIYDDIYNSSFVVKGIDKIIVEDVFISNISITNSMLFDIVSVKEVVFKNITISNCVLDSSVLFSIRDCY